MTEQEIVQYAIDNVGKDDAIKITWAETYQDTAIDGTLDLRFNHHHLTFKAVVKRELRAAQLVYVEDLANDYNHFILIAQRLYPKIKEELRRKKIAYLEANGNVYINKGDVLICIDGNKAVETKTKTPNRAFTKTGLQVVYQFLIDNEWVNRTYRDIAEHTGTGIGNVNNIFNGLKEDDFLLQLTKTEYKLINLPKLLEKWTEAYETRLKPTLAIGTYRFLNPDDFRNWKTIKLRDKTAWGGEPAGALFTDYLRPEELTLYTEESNKDLIKHYRLVPDKDGNVKAYKKFWHYETTNYNLVHPILAYADLISKGDRRCTEVANKIKDEFLQD